MKEKNQVNFSEIMNPTCNLEALFNTWFEEEHSNFVKENSEKIWKIQTNEEIQCLAEYFFFLQAFPKVQEELFAILTTTMLTAGPIESFSQDSLSNSVWAKFLYSKSRIPRFPSVSDELGRVISASPEAREVEFYQKENVKLLAKVEEQQKEISKLKSYLNKCKNSLD